MAKKLFIILAAMIFGASYSDPVFSESNLDQYKLAQQGELFSSEGAGRFSREQTRILIFLGLVSGVGLLGWYITRRGGSSGSSLALNKTSQKTLLDRVSPRLRRKLLRLINDPKTVNRLMLGIQKHHQNRSPDWIAEKVIYDFQRGR